MTRIIDVYINALRKKVDRIGPTRADPDGPGRGIRLEGELRETASEHPMATDPVVRRRAVGDPGRLQRVGLPADATPPARPHGRRAAGGVHRVRGRGPALRRHLRAGPGPAIAVLPRGGPRVRARAPRRASPCSAARGSPRQGCRAPSSGRPAPSARRSETSPWTDSGTSHLAGGVVRGPRARSWSRWPPAWPRRTAPCGSWSIVFLTIGPMALACTLGGGYWLARKALRPHRSDGRHGGRDHLQPAGPPPRGGRRPGRAGRPGPDLQRDDRATPALLRGGPALHGRRRPRAAHPAGRDADRGRGRPPLAAIARARRPGARGPARGDGAADPARLPAPVPLPRGRGPRRGRRSGPSAWITWCARWASTCRSWPRRRGWTWISISRAPVPSAVTPTGCASSSSTCSTTPSSTRRPAAR